VRSLLYYARDRAREVGELKADLRRRDMEARRVQMAYSRRPGRLSTDGVGDAEYCDEYAAEMNHDRIESWRGCEPSKLRAHNRSLIFD
jgi:hypothetical protein